MVEMFRFPFKFENQIRFVAAFWGRVTSFAGAAVGIFVMAFLHCGVAAATPDAVSFDTAAGTESPNGDFFTFAILNGYLEDVSYSNAGPRGDGVIGQAKEDVYGVAGIDVASYKGWYDLYNNGQVTTDNIEMSLANFSVDGFVVIGDSSTLEVNGDGLPIGLDYGITIFNHNFTLFNDLPAGIGQ